MIALLIPASRRGWTWRTWAVGAAYAATVILFVLANKQTTSANAIFLQSAAPLYVLVAGVVVLRERVRRPDVLLMLVLVAGLSLFLVDPGEAVATAPNPALGNALAAASGVTWAATLLGLRWLGRGPGGVGGAAGATVAGNLIAAAVCIPTAVPPTGDATDWLLIALPRGRPDRRRVRAADLGGATRRRVRGLAAAARGARPQPGLVVDRPRRAPRGRGDRRGRADPGGHRREGRARRTARHAHGRSSRPRPPRRRDPRRPAGSVGAGERPLAPAGPCCRPSPPPSSPPSPPGAAAADPPYRAVVRVLSAQERADMTPSVWRRGLPGRARPPAPRERPLRGLRRPRAARRAGRAQRGGPGRRRGLPRPLPRTLPDPADAAHPALRRRRLRQHRGRQHLRVQLPGGDRLAALVAARLRPRDRPQPAREPVRLGRRHLAPAAASATSTAAPARE